MCPVAAIDFFFMVSGLFCAMIDLSLAFSRSSGCENLSICASLIFFNAASLLTGSFGRGIINHHPM